MLFVKEINPSLNTYPCPFIRAKFFVWTEILDTNYISFNETLLICFGIQNAGKGIRNPNSDCKP